MKPHTPGGTPLKIPDDIAAKCDGPDQFERFDRLFRAVVSVPHSVIVKEEAKWKKARVRKKRATKRP